MRQSSRVAAFAVAISLSALAVAAVMVAAATFSTPATVQAQYDQSVPLMAYEHCSFDGELYVLDQGTYSIPTAFANNKISALRVAEGFEVDVFEYAVFRGQVRTYGPGEVACLTNDGFNDVITSMIIRPESSGTGSISGHITSMETGDPIAQIQVCTINYDKEPRCEATAADGSYTINNIESDNYHILAYDPHLRFFANCDGSPCNPPKVELQENATLDIVLNPLTELPPA